MALHQPPQVKGVAGVQALINEHFDAVKAGFGGQSKDAVQAIGVEGACGEGKAHRSSSRKLATASL